MQIMQIRRWLSTLTLLLLALLPTAAHAQGVVMALPQFEARTSTGGPLIGGKLWTYQCGTLTLLSTYSSSTLTVANTNPVILNGNGRAPVYVTPGLCIKYVLTTSANVTVYTQDNVISGLPSANLNPVDVGLVNGRLTLVSGSPVSADVAGASTVYFTPFRGNHLALFDGAAWVSYTFTEFSVNQPGVNGVYDVFAYYNTVTSLLTLEQTAWTNDTTRATALALQDGVYVKSGAPTRRYLGTVVISSTTNYVDTIAKRHVWNYYNRVRRPMAKTDTAANTWTYTLSVYRMANNSALNRVEFVIGVAEEPVTIGLSAGVHNGSNNVMLVIGIGFDGANPTGEIGSNVTGLISVANQMISTFGTTFTKLLPAGSHYAQWYEWSGAVSTTTWYGLNTTNGVYSGLIGFISG